ncbi:unnamed protein product [Rotaria sordida]|uniref:LITAF domain-containing protein n=1 Tax=Rotaria sordida TaxID=392033 RepID=A0A814RSH1_9BILA|nr:unnamed protein product [Rotaria sordida]CAF1137886.1 unnamed protein product [Rotaria sordida]CAF1485548.1 unnamed protein product [Rotaria sordida]CAF1487944.1 unnamed protein product [Rotaria sordida]CAF1488229.1 unnamed protein product [Rotaria sordida]
MSPYDYKGNNEASWTPNYPERLPPYSPVQQSQSIPIAAPTGDNPVSCICPYCHQTIITRVEKTNGLAVWLTAIGLCVIGCVFGCCLIPFFVDSFKDKTHYCANCNRMLRQNKVL